MICLHIMNSGEILQRRGMRYMEMLAIRKMRYIEIKIDIKAEIKGKIQVEIQKVVKPGLVGIAK